MGTGAGKITNKNIPVRVHKFFFEKIACAETAEPRMTVSYTTHMETFWQIFYVNVPWRQCRCTSGHLEKYFYVNVGMSASMFCRCGDALVGKMEKPLHSLDTSLMC